ncbi:MAG TPA: ABC transporter permease [Chloroflexota bacterium]|nr:ABC transporter permease [Chloroflexota bacterium]
MSPSYAARRVLLALLTLWGVTFVVFALVRLMPGDAVTALLQDYAYAKDVEEMRHTLGLDRPIPVQYAEWLGNVLRGNLGESLRSKTPIASELTNRIPVTVELGLLGMAIGLLIALPIGVLSAVRQHHWSDYAARALAIGMLAIPAFWLGTLAVTLPSVWFKWTPPLFYTRFTTDPLRNLGIVIIPAAILGLGLSGTLLRLTRAQMLDVLRQDYVRTARAKGLRAGAVVVRHALRNALIPIVTLIGLQVSILIGGSVVLEQIFVLPGMGRYLLEAIQYRDYPVIQALNLLFAAAIILSNLVVDLAYGWLDPRVRHA